MNINSFCVFNLGASIKVCNKTVLIFISVKLYELHFMQHTHPLFMLIYDFFFMLEIPNKRCTSEAYLKN